MQQMQFIKILLVILSCILTIEATSQTVFERITTEMGNYKINTATPPADKTTRLINELRKQRGGFNINEAMEFKLQEDRQKKDISESQFIFLDSFFRSGTGRAQLDNAVTWIYRNYYTQKELKQLLRFYKTGAGRKYADTFPLVVMQSLKAAEEIMKGSGLPK
jgi:hypothetical protein